MNLSLSEEMHRLIEKQLQSGGFSTPEEVVTAALHSLDQENHAGDFDAGELDRLLLAGEQSGPPLDGETVLNELRSLRKTAQG